MAFPQDYEEESMTVFFTYKRSGDSTTYYVATDVTSSGSNMFGIMQDARDKVAKTQGFRDVSPVSWFLA